MRCRLGRLFVAALLLSLSLCGLVLNMVGTKKKGRSMAVTGIIQNVPITHSETSSRQLIHTIEQHDKHDGNASQAVKIISQHTTPPDNSTDTEDIKLCPKESPLLRGPLKVSQQFHPPKYLERMFFFTPKPPFSPISLGGHYRPYDCQAQQRVAIIIPYRNRFKHLHILLYNLIPVLRRQQADFRIFVIEQDLPTTFNKGMLLNIGFLEALKYDNFDCFVFHDVDFLPLNDGTLYRCDIGNPIHLSNGVSKWNYTLPTKNYYGGILAISRKQYEEINGNSNLYFGWGGEDDDILLRVKHNGFKLVRPPSPLGLFDMIKHERDMGYSNDKYSRMLLHDGSNRQGIEGLKTTVYKTTLVQFKPLYTWIHVCINMTRVLQTAPLDVRKRMISWLKIAKQFDQQMKKEHH